MAYSYVGNEIAGDVVEVGKNVTKLSPGDVVIGLLDEGGLQQYNTMPEYALEMVKFCMCVQYSLTSDWKFSIARSLVFV